MHDDRALVEARITRLLETRITPAVYSRRLPLQVTAWHVPGEPVDVETALAAAYQPFEIGASWGPPWSTTWFRLSGEVPLDWSGCCVEALVDLGFTSASPGFQAEGLAYSPRGERLKGIEPANNHVPIAATARGGESVDLLVEAAANPSIDGVTDLGDLRTAPQEPIYRLVDASLAALDADVFALAMDVQVLAELMKELSVGDPRRHEILRGLERMADTVDAHDVSGTARAGRAVLADLLSSPAAASAHTVAAVGHAHIDTAWLWPLRETHRKCARTFANATALADQYPEFVFACSQAQQYAWVKDECPDVYARIKKAVAAGNWAPTGSMWVETDGNLTGGEALVRQVSYGKRFFASEFDIETKGIWLPDSFGYNAAFPQIAKLAGVDWFLSQKMSWNQINRLPHHTFWWEGIDGSRVFTHFPPVDSYNSALTGAELAYSVRNYAEKGAGTISLMPFGFGDGGGGPTREMLEKARRLRSLEGSPTVELCGPDEFFERARSELSDPPVWRGEMYLELHRGTYTTQSEIKRGNRRSEHLLRAVELWATTATVTADAEYPYEQIDRLWKRVLLHQFHDILPGSSIAWVNREARQAYAEILAELTELIARLTATICAAGDGTFIFNAAPHARAEVAVVDRSGIGATVGQVLRDESVAVWATAAALGSGRIQAGLPLGVSEVVADPHELNNGLLRVCLDDDGNAVSVYDIEADRELLAPGGIANLLQLHPDNPTDSDAWDLDRHYMHRHVDLTSADQVQLVAAGPLLAAVRVTRTYGRSTFVQTVALRAGSRQVDLRTEVDWHESEHVLKAAFPLDVHADEESAEIQFGHVQRPTHTNTSWDFARFELSHQRWVHVGEAGYGAAVVNTETYGHDVSRETRADSGTTTTLRLTLLRAPRSPDPCADIGTHDFTYALVPGADIGTAIAAGYAMNVPLSAGGTRADTERSGPPQHPLIEVDNPAIVVEAVKLADDRSGDVIVRMYESRGGRAVAAMHPGFPTAGWVVVDLLERPRDVVRPIPNDGLHLHLRPFEILTVRLVRNQRLSEDPLSALPSDRQASA